MAILSNIINEKLEVFLKSTAKDFKVKLLFLIALTLETEATLVDLTLQYSSLHFFLSPAPLCV